MKIDFKITVWESIDVSHLPKDVKAKIKEDLKGGNIQNSNDLYNYSEDLVYRTLTETEEQMSVEENEGSPTIELLEPSSGGTYYNITWTNS